MSMMNDVISNGPTDIPDNNTRIFYYLRALIYVSFSKLQGAGYVNTTTRSARFHLSTLKARN